MNQRFDGLKTILEYRFGGKKSESEIGKTESIKQQYKDKD